MTMSTTVQHCATTSLKRFKMHKQTFERRLQAVREERDDLRHLVRIPAPARNRQNPLMEEEKDTRLGEIFAKVNQGLYCEPAMAGEITERLMSRLWNLND
jgi:hypothetical protein